MIIEKDSAYVMAKTGKLMIDILPDKCDFCGCCVGVCPEDAIELKEAFISIIGPLCTNCAKCVWSCPIEVLKFDRNGILKETGRPAAAVVEKELSKAEGEDEISIGITGDGFVVT